MPTTARRFKEGDTVYLIYISFFTGSGKIVKNIYGKYPCPKSWQCFATRKQAQAALTKLRKALREARVIR